MKAVVVAFNEEKALVGAFSVITNFRMQIFGALVSIHTRDHVYLSSPRVCFSELAANLKKGLTSSMVSRLSEELQEPGPGTPGPCLYACRGNTGYNDVMIKDNRIGHEILTLIFSFNYVKIR